MKDILDSKIAMRMLICLYDGPSYGSNLSWELRTTYPHIAKISKFLKKEGFINTEKHGRVSHISLTEKGKKVAKNLIKVNTA